MKRREWIVMAGAACLAGCGKHKIVREFGRSDDEHGNPERGFYVQRAAEDVGDLTNLLPQGITLVLLTLDLKHYRNRPLDEAKLSVLDEAMRRIREAGLKVIFRAAYGFTDADFRVDPGDIALIRGHITAISGTLVSHAPWVLAVQAGMLGPWGEWHGSVHGDPPSLESRLAVANAWLEGLPGKIFLQVRRPMFLRDMKVDLRRCGCHNDALLALPDDMGTYAEPGWDRSREIEWCGDALKAVPFGGETVPASVATPPARALGELESLHTTFLNNGYHEGTLMKWKASLVNGENLLETFRRRLGYRLSARHLELDGSQGRLTLRSDGFAAPLSKRRVAFAWMDSSAGTLIGEPVLQSCDPREWQPGDKDIILPFQLPPRPVNRALVPAVRFADDSDALMEDGRHAIRLAGKGIGFDGKTGWNRLA